MANLFGRKYTKSELLRRVGNIDQVCGVRRVVLDDGPSKGVTALEFYTGSGLEFRVLADRGLDISAAAYKGQSLCWRSPVGDISPAFYQPEGLEWLRTFPGGLVSTCGLTYAGAPTIDEGRPLGLHGRYTSLPASEISFGGLWDGNDYVITASGTIREAHLFGPNIAVHRTITAWLGESRILIEDEIVNEGWSRQPLMLLYHCNFGFPLVDAASRVYAPARQTFARFSLEPVEPEVWSQFAAPTAGIEERVFYHDLKADRNGEVTVMLANESLAEGLAAYIKYNQDALPKFVQWKMPGEGAYITGLEPANCWVDGRNVERERKTLEHLRPGQSKSVRLEIGVLEGKPAIAEMRKKSGL